MVQDLGLFSIQYLRVRRIVAFAALLCFSWIAMGSDGRCVEQPVQFKENGTSDTFFVSRFKIEPLKDSILVRMRGKSLKKGCPVDVKQLRYLTILHHDGHGRILQGEMIVHHTIAEQVLEIFKALYKAGYPIERMRLVDDYGASDERSMLANNTSAFNYRMIAGSKKLSKHSQGLAIDINPFYNPCVRMKNGKQEVQPAQARPYAQRKKKFAYKIDANDLCCKLFKKYGFVWGGDWHSLKDYQHFEK